MKKTLRSSFAFFAFFFLQNFLLGQNLPVFQCASDAAMQSQPALLERQQSLEKAILQKNKNGNLEKSSTPPYTLPIVVHIVHDNGVGDIPDAQIVAAVEQLNQAFAHQGYYADQGDGHDTQIQFCLAKRDPNGNATNGITRTNSPLTTFDKDLEDQALKDLRRWNPNDYINVWVVGAINSSSSGPGVVGYAYLASAHGEPFDGIVCEADYFGTSPEKNVVFTHEMGHYLNLYHTFQGGCPNDDCTSSGDRVCDTPPDQATFSACGFNSCNSDTDDASSNNPLTTNVADRTENYMDYSPFECYHAFTEGQANRMYDAIEMARNSLLESQACYDPCTLPISLDFLPSATEVFAGQTVTFDNLSSGATLFEWRLDGVLFASTEDANYTFNDIGTFEVELFVTNSDANCFERMTVTITVKCPVIPEFSPNSMEVGIGEPFVATNISQNATGYEWFINGVLVSTATDLSYTFSNDGIYTVVLVATDGECANDFLQKINVVNQFTCQDSVLGNYFEFIPKPSGTVGFFDWDLMPDGGLITNPYTPPTGVAARFNPDGTLLWQEQILIPNNGIEDMSIFDDSSVGFTIDAGDKVFKLDDTGTIEWVKSLTLSQSTIELRAFSTGDGMIVYTTTSSSPPTKLFMVKFLSDGTVAWNKVYTSPLAITFIDHWSGAGCGRKRVLPRFYCQ